MMLDLTPDTARLIYAASLALLITVIGLIVLRSLCHWLARLGK